METVKRVSSHAPLFSLSLFPPPILLLVLPTFPISLLCLSLLRLFPSRCGLPCLRRNSLVGLLVAHASDCHLFISVQFLCGPHHFAGKNAFKHLGFEDHEAVVRRLRSRVGVVPRCAMCKICVLSHFLSGWGFFIERGKCRTTHGKQESETPKGPEVVGHPPLQWCVWTHKYDCINGSMSNCGVANFWKDL